MKNETPVQAGESLLLRARLQASEEALIRAEERLHHYERLAILGKLVEGVSHDFNNVLQGMMGCSDLLLLSDGIGDGFWEYSCTGKNASHQRWVVLD